MAMIAKAKASSASGFIGVSRDAAIAAGGAPARPLLKWKETDQCRLAANQASTSRAWFAGSSSRDGIHADV